MKSIRNARKLSVEKLDRRRLLASDLTLIKDINTEPDYFPILDSVRDPIVLGTLAFFTQKSTDTGLELWRTDGTQAGTFLLKDIAEGPADSNPYGLMRLGDQVFFSATSLEFGTELWVTDGTSEGTRIFADLYAAENSSYPNPLEVIGSELFVSAYTSTGGRLLKTDGINYSFVEAIDSAFQPLSASVNNRLLMNRFSAFDSGIYSVDATTDVLEKISVGYVSQFSDPIGQKRLLGTSEGLLLTDGTAAGTTTVSLPLSGYLGIEGIVQGHWLVSSVGYQSSQLWSVTLDGTSELLIEVTGSPFGLSKFMRHPN